MEKETPTNAAPMRHELLDFVRENPRLADAHAAFLSAGGERALELAVNSVRGEMFPWDQPQHVQASFGAFVAGATWMAKLLRNLVVLSNNRAAALRMLMQVDGAIPAEERRLLLEQYGYSEAELADYEKQNAAAKPKPKSAAKPRRTK